MLHDSIPLAFAFLLVIELVRALPWPKQWRQKKPFSCDVCMSSWFSIFMSFARPEHALEAVAAGGICLFLLVVFLAPRRPPPEW
jgi:hypothetical protein